MDVAKEVIMSMKQTKKSHVGYGLQKESEALVKHILLNMVKSSLPDMKPDVKNEEDCIRYREEGNQHFVAGDDIEAITSYTMSLAYADTNELMAHALANRSAALYRKQMFKECFMDVDAALDLGYPKEKREKLKARGVKAVEELKKLLKETEAKEKNGENANKDLPSEGKEKSLDSMESSLEKEKFLIISKLDNNGEESSEIKFTPKVEEDKLTSNLDLKDSSASKPPKPRHLLDPDVMSLKYGSSEEAPANSAGVRISYNAEYGRHLVATREFKPGDLITIEAPYSWVLYQDKFYTHCHYCLERCYNLMPCSNCPLIQYCSEKCRKISWEKSHCMECPVLAVLFNLLCNWFKNAFYSLCVKHRHYFSL